MFSYCKGLIAAMISIHASLAAAEARTFDDIIQLGPQSRILVTEAQSRALDLNQRYQWDLTVWQSHTDATRVRSDYDSTQKLVDRLDERIFKMDQIAQKLGERILSEQLDKTKERTYRDILGRLGNHLSRLYQVRTELSFKNHSLYAQLTGTQAVSANKDGLQTASHAAKPTLVRAIRGFPTGSYRPSMLKAGEKAPLRPTTLVMSSYGSALIRQGADGALSVARVQSNLIAKRIKPSAAPLDELERVAH